MSKIKKVTTENIYDDLGNLVKKIETTEYESDNVTIKIGSIQSKITADDLIKKLNNYIPCYGVIPNFDNDSTYFKKTK